MTLAIVALALVAALVAAELGARHFIRTRTGYYVWPPGHRLELYQDSAVFPDVEPRVRFFVNRDGERGRDVRRGAPGLFRVLLAGGSPVECLALDQDTSWSGALERLLSAPERLGALGARRAHVGSIGRSGLSSEHLDLIFRHVLPRYGRLGAIVIMVGGNDVFLWLEDGAPNPLPPTAVSVARTFAVHPEMRFGWSPRRWALADAARRARRVWLRPVEVRTDAGAWVARARRMRAEAKELRTTVPDPAPMLERFERHFERALRRACAHADRVLVTRQPWLETTAGTPEAARIWHGGLGKAWKQEITVYHSLEVLNRLMAAVDARAAAVADRVGIEHLDLRTVLAPTLENYYDYVHYTPAGAARVARAVADALARPRRAAAPVAARAAAVTAQPG